MGGQSARNDYRASSGAGLQDAPTHPPRRPVQSGGSSPQGRLRPSQRKCSPRKKGRVEWLSGPEYCSHRGVLLLVCRGGLVSAVGCGPLRWLVVVVVAEHPGSWTVDFGTWVRVPPWWVGVRCDRTGREGTRPGSFPPARLPSGLRGRIKTHGVRFVCACVRVGPVC